MKKIILISLVLFISMPILKSQVTIGSLTEPAKAALLDLKTKNADNDNVTVEANKGGGLVLPRVKLVDENTLQPFISIDGSDWMNQTNRDNAKKVHTGMMVYNLETTKGFSKGIYTWNGTQWIPNKTDVSIAADNGLTKSGDDIQLGGTLKNNTIIDQQNYSITFNNGKIRMPNVKDNIPDNSTNEVAALGIDSDTGELFAMKASNKQGVTTKPISYLVYKLKGKEDWIENFNTQIKASEYTLVIVGSSFRTAATYGSIIPNGTVGSTIPAGSTAISEVSADKKVHNGATQTDSEFWHIHADYVGATTSDGGHGTWTIYCLVINHSVLNAHPNNPMEYGGTGKESFIAKDPPIGLE
jgi:hypothetical protein